VVTAKRDSGTERLVAVLNYRHPVGTAGMPSTATVNNIAPPQRRIVAGLSAPVADP
jgi:hypothetical protein